MTTTEVVTVYVVYVVYVLTPWFNSGAGPPATWFGFHAKSAWKARTTATGRLRQR